MPQRLAQLLSVALLVGGAACAETPEPEAPEPERPEPERPNATQDDSIEAVRTRANAGDANAQYNLGMMYAAGLDSVEAVAWFRQAAEQGHAEAQYNLGLMYDDGEGVPQDFGEAAAWYRQAAEQGIAVAQYLLGVMYNSGEGVPQDAVEAYKWFNLATTYADASQRERYAEERDYVAGRLTPEQLAEAQRLARDWDDAHSPN